MRKDILLKRFHNITIHCLCVISCLLNRELYTLSIPNIPKRHVFVISPSFHLSIISLTPNKVSIIMIEPIYKNGKVMCPLCVAFVGCATASAEVQDPRLALSYHAVSPLKDLICGS